MEASKQPCPPAEKSDVFSISDQALSDRLQFIQEIGFGNWGSVWLCRPKLSSSSADALGTARGQKIAVKLVHRSKTSTTAARVRSLWNEMKIIRNFKNDPHPSIIPFHSFVLTPSYALITMTYLPTLIPVEVEESKAREWFHFLLSGIDFLHRRGVVHNDIKPANILLSHKSIPVLVDFGFAEKYELDSPTAFHSNLSYGTPEYLSPERARGLSHDTRKSDVWSLGITFFEILAGRTPFENTDGEQLNTKEDLEQYWQRTLRGTWIGTWKMTPEMEKFLQRMISPNADLRCTASQAMADEVWRPRRESMSTHRRSASETSSVVFEKDMAKLLSTPLSARSTRGKLMTPPGLDSPASVRKELASREFAKSKSQPKVAPSKAAPPKKRPHVHPIPDLSPVKASPPTSPLTSATGKENAKSPKAGVSTPARRGLGVLAARNENLPQTAKTPISRTQKEKPKPIGAVLSRSLSRRSSLDVKGTSTQRRGKESTSVRDRVRDWERERERLREMARLEEIERERDEELEKEKKQQKVQKQNRISIKEPEANKENHHHGMAALNNIVLPSPNITPPLTQVTNKMPATQTPSRPSSAQGKKIGHAIRASIGEPLDFTSTTGKCAADLATSYYYQPPDKTLSVYKSTTLNSVANGRSTPARSLDIDRKELTPEIISSRRGSTQIRSRENEVNSSLPVVCNAVQSQKLAADSRQDRLTLWMQNVERVVEDARQNFAASAKVDVPLPSLPAAPRNVSSGRSTGRSSRLPRKVLAASQIFADYNNSLMADGSSSANTSALAASTSDATSTNGSSSVAPAETPATSVLSPPASTEPSKTDFVIPEIHTPSRQRRATVSMNSPVSIHRDAEMSPSKRREKCRSHGNLLQKRIASISQLEAEINKPIEPEPNPRLSEMFDRSIFIATPLRSCEDLDSPLASMDDLTSSPCHIEPYPQRKALSPDALPDTPSQRKLEGVYDRFLMATSSVKRVGKGYQSDFIPPPPPSAFNQSSLGSSTGGSRRHSRALFGASKTPMPPPVSSDDVAHRRGVSVDEMGVISFGPVSTTDVGMESTGQMSLSFMRKAIKAIKPSSGRNSKRLSRMVVA